MSESEIQPRARMQPRLGSADPPQARRWQQASFTSAVQNRRGLNPSRATETQDMIKFFYNLAPNPMKVALFLEEVGLPYEPVPVDTRKGEQHLPAYTKINPNAKCPALVDGDAIVFDSNAILLYLAEKTGQLLPANTLAARGEMLSWLMFVATGIGPYSGQCVHFRHFAPEPKAYALNRYDFEAWRHWRLIDERLATRSFMLGDAYTLVDIALWGWARMVPFVLGNQEAWAQLPHLKRWFDTVSQRPAAQRAEALKQRHAFKAEMDDAARQALFPQNARLAG
jgi:GST-like protein